MPFKLFTILFALFLFACQHSSKDKKEKPKASTQEEVQEIKDKKAVPSETARLITGSDSILISKKKVVEAYDRQWSSVFYQFYNESKPLANWQRAVNNFIRKSLYRPNGQAVYAAPLTPELVRTSLLAFKKDAQRAYEESMVWGRVDSFIVNDQFETFVGIKYFSSEYTGGAHGSDGVGYYYFDKASAKELQLKDFINTKKELLRAAELVFRKKVGLKANTPFNETDFWFSEDFYLSDNFEISDQGLTFFYNPYEISSYANGIIEFSLTRAQIAPYFKRKID